MRELRNRAVEVLDWAMVRDEQPASEEGIFGLSRAIENVRTFLGARIRKPAGIKQRVVYYLPASNICTKICLHAYISRPRLLTIKGAQRIVRRDPRYRDAVVAAVDKA